ncbi:hypothetical protein ACIGO8_08810 [Streptomyces sp. NPDC053493]|uniref:hypothetical protein n=1 Tax=Streptomyces sp. NPDC053493 TaxID=3365705 RepID=UPI0037D17CFF
MRALRAAASAALFAPLAAALVLTAPAAVAEDDSVPKEGGAARGSGLARDDDLPLDAVLPTGGALPTDGGLPKEGLPTDGGLPKDGLAKDELPKDGLPKDDDVPQDSGIPAADALLQSEGFPKDGTGHGITSFGFSVTPRTVAPGGTVTLKAEGCEAPSVTVESGVFDTVTLTEGRHGTATVDLEAKAGAQYEVTFVCKGERGTTTLTVAEHGTEHGTGHSPAPDIGAHKGVRAGFGGDSGGVGTAEMVTGGVLIAGALGAAVVLTRRRGRERDRDRTGA